MVRKAYNANGISASGPYSHAVDAGELVFFIRTNCDECRSHAN